MKLKLLKRKDIDTQKWDLCVKNAENSLVYAYSWYLDTVADNWSGIVSENYECVMPVVWKKKIGIKYTYRAFLIQQLGIFCSNNKNIDSALFLKILNSKFLFIDYNFNSFNKIQGKEIIKNTNYELNLNKKYEEIFANYSKKHQNSLKKAQQNNLTINRNITIEDLIALKKKYLSNNLTQKNFDILKKLFTNYPQKAKIYGILKNNELLSASFYFIQDKRIYFLLSVSSEKGKKLGSAFFLKDKFIEDFSDKNFILDFEGSNIPGIAHFFKGWGSKKIFYNNYNTNLLKSWKNKNIK